MLAIFNQLHLVLKTNRFFYRTSSAFVVRLGVHWIARQFGRELVRLGGQCMNALNGGGWG